MYTPGKIKCSDKDALPVKVPDLSIPVSEKRKKKKPMESKKILHAAIAILSPASCLPGFEQNLFRVL
jgi:hypothetical protein